MSPFEFVPGQTVATDFARLARERLSGVPAALSGDENAALRDAGREPA